MALLNHVLLMCSLAHVQAFLFAPVVTWLVVIGWAVYIHPRWMIRNKKYLELTFYTIRLLFDYYFLGLWVCVYLQEFLNCSLISSFDLTL
jgi:hypothetical protein